MTIPSTPPSVPVGAPEAGAPWPDIATSGEVERSIEACLSAVEGISLPDLRMLQGAVRTLCAAQHAATRAALLSELAGDEAVKALGERLGEEIGRYGLECLQSGELAPRKSLTDALQSVQHMVAALAAERDKDRASLDLILEAVNGVGLGVRLVQLTAERDDAVKQRTDANHRVGEFMHKLDVAEAALPDAHPKGFQQGYAAGIEAAAKGVTDYLRRQVGYLTERKDDPNDAELIAAFLGGLVTEFEAGLPFVPPSSATEESE